MNENLLNISTGIILISLLFLIALEVDRRKQKKDEKRMSKLQKRSTIQ